MSNDDDYLSGGGYDPDEVLGYDVDQAVAASNANLGDAVPATLAGVYDDDTQDLQTVLASELTAVEQGFRDRKDKEAERLELAINSDYWFCICFATAAQRDAFLKATRWRELGRRYLDGRDLAKRLGVELPPDPDWPTAKRDTSWDQFAMTVEENRSIEM